MCSSDLKAARELIDLRNQAEQTVYQTEKTLDEHKDKLDEETVLAITTTREQLDKVKQGDDAAAIRTALEAYTQAAQKLAEKLYANQGPQPGAESGSPPPSGEGPSQGHNPGGTSEDDIIDADFEVKS